MIIIFNIFLNINWQVEEYMFIQLSLHFIFLLDKEMWPNYVSFDGTANCSTRSFIFLVIWREVVTKWKYLSICRSDISLLYMIFIIYWHRSYLLSWNLLAWGFSSSSLLWLIVFGQNRHFHWWYQFFRLLDWLLTKLSLLIKKKLHRFYIFMHAAIVTCYNHALLGDSMEFGLR